jgi:hypothetical protein
MLHLRYDVGCRPTPYNVVPIGVSLTELTIQTKDQQLDGVVFVAMTIVAISITS